MILANVNLKSKWFYACVATTMSVFGGLFGYAIGFLAYAQIAEPLLVTLGKQSAMDLFFKTQLTKMDFSGKNCAYRQEYHQFHLKLSL